jgi:hypothetical protein
LLPKITPKNPYGVSVNGTFVEAEIYSLLYLSILSSTSAPLTLMTVQVPNLALTHTKRMTVRLTNFPSFWPIFFSALIIKNVQNYARVLKVAF